MSKPLVLLTDALAKTAKVEEDADLDGLIADIPETITQTEEGVIRVSKIVEAIKEFAHSGGETQAVIDVNRTIDSTIAISRGEWGSFADVTTSHRRQKVHMA